MPFAMKIGPMCLSLQKIPAISLAFQAPIFFAFLKFLAFVFGKEFLVFLVLFAFFPKHFGIRRCSPGGGVCFAVFLGF